MKYILDTHAFIWYAIGDEKLSARAKNIIDSNNEIFVSVASIWEMAIKVSLGKLAFKKAFKEVVEEQLEINNYSILQLENAHLFTLSDLDMHHRDPFDRIIICQSIVENIPIISIDKRFKDYKDIELVW